MRMLDIFLVQDSSSRPSAYDAGAIAAEPTVYCYYYHIYIWRYRVSIPVPRACKARALPTELSTAIIIIYIRTA